MTSRAKLFAFLVLVVVAAGGLYLNSLMHRMRSEKTAQTDASARARLAEAALRAENAPEQTVTLFFPSNDEGVLLQESRRMTLAANDTDRIRQIFLALLEGSAQGNNQPLPAATDLRAAFLGADGTAYLDLAGGSMPLFEPGIGAETLAVYSIVDSICYNIPTVKRVKFLIQGQEVQTLDGHVDLTEAFVPDTNLKSPAP
jgi:Sporulation and spore germination